ncbi:MAG: MerR family transcriptional regulator [Proteiniphilum sp.]|nr:MerR family transcriptional regulator [Proteiniphilum sp.]
MAGYTVSGGGFMNYKISEVSKLTNIPIDSIRYFEKVGIVLPVRIGTYRYYSEEDIYTLCEYKKMRSFGMKMDEVKEFFKIGNMGDYARKFIEFQKKYDAIIKYYSALEKSTKQSITTIEAAEENIGRYKITKLPAKYYIDFYFEQKENSPLIRIWKKWVDDYYPLVEYIAVFEKNTFEKQLEERKSIIWANALDKDIVENLNIPIDRSVKLIPEQTAVYTVVVNRETPLLPKELFCELEIFLKENNLHISGDGIGKLISRIKNEEKGIRYIGLWIPVEAGVSSAYGETALCVESS